jgi:hypothetical protein
MGSTLTSRNIGKERHIVLWFLNRENIHLVKRREGEIKIVDHIAVEFLW